MTQRDRILEIASAEIGPGRRADYWREVYGSDPGAKLAWCGVFCLWALHQAGIARETKWKLGVGFIGPLGLKQTRTPSRGDIVYLPQHFQHHALFDYEYDGWIHSVDGNQPGVQQKRRRRDGIVFYSIDPLLDATDQDTKPGPPRYPTLRIGSSGDPVKALQKALNMHGADPQLVVDGGFGVRTDIAVRAFQTANKLKADGVVGAITWGMLLDGP